MSHELYQDLSMLIYNSIDMWTARREEAIETIIEMSNQQTDISFQKAFENLKLAQSKKNELEVLLESFEKEVPEPIKCIF